MSVSGPPLEDLPGAGNVEPAVDSPARGSRLKLEPRRNYAPSSYGRVVMLLKIALPAIAIVLTAAVVAWPFLEDRSAVEQTARVLVESGDLDAMRMLNPNYAGLDEKAQPFTVTATEMHKPSPDSPSIDLVQPKADLLMADGSWAYVTADKGRYDQVSQLLELQGNVNFFQDEGYELRTAGATFDLVGGSAYGFDPIEGQGPFGTLRAEGGFQMLNRGEQITLLGKSNVVVRPDAESER